MKDVDFSGKVAVVTGAASGMGLMASQEFARLGAKVVMCDLDEAVRLAANQSINMIVDTLERALFFFAS